MNVESRCMSGVIEHHLIILLSYQYMIGAYQSISEYLIYASNYS